MYKVQDKPDKKAVLDNSSKVEPLVTLKDEYGGVSHIIEDDHCYVLINKNSYGSFSMVTHWYREAVEAVRNMYPPLPKAD